MNMLMTLMQSTFLLRILGKAATFLFVICYLIHLRIQYKRREAIDAARKKALQEKAVKNRPLAE